MPIQAPPLILTLKLDAVSFARLDALRRQHFPPERNFLSAHLTLFHALPGEEEDAICAQLQSVAMNRLPIRLMLQGIRLLGRGVAITVESAELRDIRTALERRFHPWLSRQDRQGFRPHVTVQNKVAPHDARALYEKLVSEWVPTDARGEGLLLWHYLGGPWRQVAEFPFDGQ